MQIKLLLCCKKMLIMGILTGSLKARSLATLYDIKSSDNKSAIKNKIYQHFQSVVRKSLDVHIEQDKKLKTYALFKTNFKFEPYLDIFSDYNIRCNFLMTSCKDNAFRLSIL